MKYDPEKLFKAPGESSSILDGTPLPPALKGKTRGGPEKKKPSRADFLRIEIEAFTDHLLDLEREENYWSSTKRQTPYAKAKLKAIRGSMENTRYHIRKMRTELNTLTGDTC